MSNGSGGVIFWKLAGPIFAGMVIGAISLVGLFLDRRMSRIESDVQFLIKMHLGVADADFSD